LYEYPATNMVTKNIGKYVHFAVFSADEWIRKRQLC
jgi:hypothetical protein